MSFSGEKKSLCDILSQWKIKRLGGWENCQLQFHNVRTHRRCVKWWVLASCKCNFTSLKNSNQPLHCAMFGMISNTKGWKKNRINDESMENWSALHINGRKVHYREQSLVVATAKIIIMSALGPNPCLAPSSASISRIPYTFGVTSHTLDVKSWYGIFNECCQA